jgi:hypothetical protein
MSFLMRWRLTANRPSNCLSTSAAQHSHFHPSLLFASRSVAATPTSLPPSHDVVAALLQRRVEDLEEMLLKRDAMIRVLLTGGGGGSAGGCGSTSTSTPAQAEALTAQHCVHVANDMELERAFKQRAPFIALAEGKRFVLLPQPCHVRDASIVLFGKAEIEGCLKLTNCTLDATDVTFVSPERHLPIIDATGAKGNVRLTNCSLCGGRDGLYLSNGARGTVRRCNVRDNVRGVFEGLGCHVSVTSSQFTGNWFHAVLLNNPKHDRALQFFPEDPATATPHSGNTTAKSHPSTRADVVFQYNPMEDRYSDVFYNGVPVVLTDEHSTASLCDATW